MLAARIHEYGGPEVLRLEEVPTPSPGPRDVLVRVVATSVNPVDWKVRCGGQRGIMPYRLPWILGLDLSGVVEAVGADVTRFSPGDEVWSSPRHTRPGTYAEFTLVDERELAKKPRSLSHEEAASMPLVGLTAYQCLVRSAGVRPGERLLIHAGAGGVGTFAVQLAKHLGAYVVTTASPKNHDFVRALGADMAIDYRSGSFADACAPVDVILDSIGESVFEDNLRALRRGGRLANITVDVVGHTERHGPALGLVTLGALMVKLHVVPLMKKGIRVRHVIKRSDGADLAAIAQLVDQGAIKPVIERVLPLSEIQEAHRLSETHRSRGKIVLRVASA